MQPHHSMSKFFILLCFNLYSFYSFTQSSSYPKIKKIFLEKTDSSSNCYTIIYPNNQPYVGYVLLMPGFGESAEKLMQQTDLPFKLAQNQILTIIPTFQDGVLSLGVDSLSQLALVIIIKDVVTKNKLEGQKYFVGGFSIGGSCAIQYAENASAKPTAVFAIDPPLDFERFYHSAKRDIRLSKEKEASQENIYMIARLEKETGGTPSTHLDRYYQLSPYSFSDTTQSAIKKLINTPLRIYTEPDVSWWLKERNADLTSMNATTCSAMINELNRLGNQKAQFMITHNKGYRKPDQKRHPHSWSIVDNDELINWLLTQ